MDAKEDHTENLQGGEAIQKLKDIVDRSAMCMFTTHLSSIPLTSRPMSTLQVDDEGNLWFLSAKDSKKNVEITEDEQVHLFYLNSGNSEYLSLSGVATILYNRSKIEELWNAFIKAWFTEGKDDPRISVIKVQPKQVYYWDTKHGKMVSLLKIMTGMVIGKTMDDSLEGALNV